MLDILSFIVQVLWYLLATMTILAGMMIVLLGFVWIISIEINEIDTQRRKK